MRIDPVHAPQWADYLARYRAEIRARSAHLPTVMAPDLGGTGWRKPTPADAPVSHDALWQRNGEIA